VTEQAGTMARARCGTDCYLGALSIRGSAT
jgi:hypothetical protein